MSVIKSICFVAGVTFSYAVLVFIGTALSGAGHGSDYFGAALLAPFSAFSDRLWVLPAGLSLWGLVALLIALRRFVWCRLAASALLVVHYIGVVIMTLLREDWYEIDRVWSAAWMIVVLTVGVYFVSQGLMWALIIWRPHAG